VVSRPLVLPFTKIESIKMSFFTEELFNWLLKQGESCWLDFKREIHSNKDEFLKDILALANADHQNDRYLLFGIQDGNKKGIGLDLKETWLKKEENFYKWFRDLRFNHRPSVQFKFLSFEGKLFACLKIENQPYKPYLSTKDNTNDNHIIWTREDHTNQKADDGDMQRMWRERLGLDKSIKERFFLYLEDFKNWTQTNDQYGCFYYNDFPEFTLVGDDEESSYDWKDHWTDKTDFVVKRTNLNCWQFKYHTTTITSTYILGADDNKCTIPYPEVEGRKEPFRFYFSKKSKSYKLALFFHNRQNHHKKFDSHDYYSWDSILKRANLPIED
jgi:hypothetical protein